MFSFNQELVLSNQESFKCSAYEIHGNHFKGGYDDILHFPKSCTYVIMIRKGRKCLRCIACLEKFFFFHLNSNDSYELRRFRLMIIIEEVLKDHNPILFGN